MITAVIFDMDGVILNNDRFHRLAFEEMCNIHGFVLNDAIYESKIVGKKNEDIFPSLFEDKILTKSEIASLAEEKEATYRNLIAPVIAPTPGLIDFLDYLKKHNIPMAVASNAPAVNIDFHIAQLKLESYFDFVVGSAMVARGKPAPDIYLKAAQLLGKQPGECLVFEDTATGITAAKAAGTKTVALTTTHTAAELPKTDVVIKDFTEAVPEKLLSL